MTIGHVRFNSLPDDPEETEILHIFDLNAGATMTCESDTFTLRDIVDAIEWSHTIADAGLGRGKKSDRYKKGRFPHSYTDEDLGDWGASCPNGNEDRQTYPLIKKNGPYNGGYRNKEWGPHRVLYMLSSEKIDDEQSVYFCGGITHENAPTTPEFVRCTVNNN